MTADIERRIAELESRIGANAVCTLHLANGIVHRISGTARHFFMLAEAAKTFVPAVSAGDTIPETSLTQELTWIRDALEIHGPNHLFEVLRAQLIGPTPRGTLNPNSE